MLPVHDFPRCVPAKITPPGGTTLPHAGLMLHDSAIPQLVIVKRYTCIFCAAADSLGSSQTKETPSLMRS